MDDYIKDNVYEGMIGVEWQVVARGISKYSPDEGEDPDYDQKFIVYKQKLKEMRNKQTPPTSYLSF